MFSVKGATLRTLTFNCSLGDSNAAVDEKPGKAVEAVLNAVSKWLLAEFGYQFVCAGNSLPIGRQQDAYSCGVCAINSLAHILFGDPLFTHDRRELLRLDLFSLLTREQIKSVSVLTL